MLGTIIRIMGNYKKRYELNKYTDFTIAEYFRKQGASIGTGTRIQIRSLGAEPYLISIGNHCMITEGVRFLTHDGAVWPFTDAFPDLQSFGTIDIRDNCFIGINSIIKGKVTIGPNSIVGAGAIVTKDVPPGTVVAGNPAKIISSVEEYRQKTMERWREQKPKEYFKGFNTNRNYSPADIQESKEKELHILREHLVRLLWGNQKGDDR